MIRYACAAVTFTALMGCASVPQDPAAQNAAVAKAAQECRFIYGSFEPRLSACTRARVVMLTSGRTSSVDQWELYLGAMVAQCRKRGLMPDTAAWFPCYSAVAQRVAAQVPDNAPSTPAPAIVMQPAAVPAAPPMRMPGPPRQCVGVTSGPVTTVNCD